MPAAVKKRRDYHKMDEQIRIRLLELLDQLLGLAAETGMKQRITDALQECRGWMDTEEMTLPIWERVIRQVEDTFASMEQQILGEPVQVAGNGGAMVTQEEVRQRMMKIWNQSNAANIQAGKEYEQRGKQICRQIAQEMSDWSNPQVNDRLLRDFSDFNARCIRVQQDYDRKMACEAEQYIDEMAGRYMQAMNRIRELTAALDSRQVSLTGRDFYEKWDSSLSEWVTDLKKQQKQAAAGGHLLREFGSAQGGMLRTLAEKMKRRQTALIAVLVLLLAFIVVVPLLADAVQTLFMDGEEAVWSAAEYGAKNAVLDIAEQAVGLSTAGVSTAFSLLKGVVYALGAALYVLVALFIKKRCRSRLLVEMKAYLQQQVHLFWSANPLEQAACRYIATAREHTMLLFHDRLEAMFGHAFVASKEQAPAEKIKALRMKWNIIKNEG